MKALILMVTGIILLATTTQQARGNEINRWNDVTLSGIRTARLTPPLSSRALAMVHIAMFDAVNAIENKYSPYAPSRTAGQDYSAELAAAAAARHVLTEMLPLQKYAFEYAFKATADRLKNHPRAAESIQLGEETATNVLHVRGGDTAFMNSNIGYVAEPSPGRWVPTFPTFESPLLPLWGQVPTFALTSGSQFRPQAPPALNSAEYQTALNDVLTLGAKNSTVRTADQTEIARFWADGSGTNTPPGHFNILARTVAQSLQYDLVKTAHMLAVLNIAMADSAIACWDAKYAYWFWRPITAIRDSGIDSTWEPLIFTPYFPEYLSGHSTFSGAAQTVLSHLFGRDDIAFTIPSDGLPGVTRHYAKISDATAEAGRSRIYGGIHFEFSNQEGQRLGALIGQHVINTVLRETAH